MDRYEKDSLILPSAFSALAFEHVNEIAAQRIHNHSDDCEFLAATAGRVGLIFDNSNLLGAKYLHGRASSQVRWREMLMLAVPTSLNLTILNIAGMTMIIVSIIVYALVYRILGIALGLIVLMAVTSVLSTVMTRRIVQGADVRAGEQPGS